MATVTAINISEKRGTVKHTIDSAYLRIDHGIVGDAHAGNWHRQISLLGQESIDKMTALVWRDWIRANLRKISQQKESACIGFRWEQSWKLALVWWKSHRSGNIAISTVRFTKRLACVSCQRKVFL